MKDCQSIHITEIGESMMDMLTIQREKLIWYDENFYFKINVSNKFSTYKCTPVENPGLDALTKIISMLSMVSLNISKGWRPFCCIFIHKFFRS